MESWGYVNGKGSAETIGGIMGLPGQFDVKLPLTRRKRAVAKRAQYTRLLAIIKKLEKKR